MKLYWILGNLAMKETLGVLTNLDAEHENIIVCNSHNYDLVSFFLNTAEASIHQIWRFGDATLAAGWDDYRRWVADYEKELRAADGSTINLTAILIPCPRRVAVKQGMLPKFDVGDYMTIDTEKISSVPVIPFPIRAYQIGSTGDTMHPAAIHFLDRSVVDMAALLYHSKLHVAADGLYARLAAVLGTPTLMLHASPQSKQLNGIGWLDNGYDILHGNGLNVGEYVKEILRRRGVLEKEQPA